MKGRPRDDDTTARERVQRDEDEENDGANVACVRVGRLSRRPIVSVYYKYNYDKVVGRRAGVRVIL